MKVQAVLKEMGEQTANFLGLNNGLVLVGASGYSGWLIEMKNTNLNSQRFDGNGLRGRKKIQLKYWTQTKQ
ncbi:hypothetical protein [Lysinibacillus sp. 3P01SB]|uniref:hypothetical protein n=1 Tax=Lysinibacillus sp. 3P01SB TaxID=3132284 RepID=UPI0039A5F16D